MSKSPWIQTYTGLRAHILNLCAEQILMEDIAHSLALTCRFRGHCRGFYSVAQHSVLAAQLAPTGLKMKALLHDAFEAYFSDVARPIKNLVTIGGRDIDELENEILGRIMQTYGVTPPTDEEARLIKDVDNALLLAEARDLMHGSPSAEEWGIDSEPYEGTITPWPWELAKERFLACFKCLYDNPECETKCVPGN